MIIGILIYTNPTIGKINNTNVIKIKRRFPIFDFIEFNKV